MGNIGPLELVVVLIIALVVLGPKRLPDAGRALGRGINEFKGALTGDNRDDDDDEKKDEKPKDEEDKPAPLPAAVAAHPSESEAESKPKSD